MACSAHLFWSLYIVVSKSVFKKIFKKNIKKYVGIRLQPPCNPTYKSANGWKDVYLISTKPVDTHALQPLCKVWSFLHALQLNNRLSCAVFACAQNLSAWKSCSFNFNLLPTNQQPDIMHHASCLLCRVHPLLSVKLFPLWSKHCIFSTDDGLQNGPGQHRNLQGKLLMSREIFMYYKKILMIIQ